ncbi:MAG TPA: hypothetical protein VKA68_02945 [bacterium]|nr:hypothetical protein [bacterium]
MRQISGALFAVLFFSSSVFAGGIVTNTNQSAEFIRMLNRNASMEMDGVYYNPAGLLQQDEGFQLYLSNQVILQQREVITHYPNFNFPSFSGETTVPFYPNVYLLYKTGELAFSAGLTPIGGGGSAEYPEGLPSFEFPVASLVGIPASVINPALAPYGNITGYSMDASFTGSSIYLGGQVNVGYAVSEEIAVSAGARFVSARNTYEGSLENVILSATNGSITGVIPNIEVDAVQTGVGYTGILGINFTTLDILNIGIRYETLTKLEVENDTEKDDTGALLDGGMFPDGAKTGADIPATLAMGVGYQLHPQLRLQAGLTYFFNEDVDWDGRQALVDNGSEYGVGLEYRVTNTFLMSGGILRTLSGATNASQSDLKYDLDALSLGIGARYSLNAELALTAALSHTSYEDGTNGASNEIFKEEYQKSSTVYTIGLQYAIR